MPGIIDVLLILVFGLVTFMVANEGAWGACLMTVIVLLAGLIAMNYFEPIAASFPASWSFRADFIALVGLFASVIGLLRLASYKIAPDEVDTPEAFHEIGRWGAGALCGWITTCFLLAALHTAPMPREFLGFKPERKNLLNVIAPDRQWLGFTQYASNRGFSTMEVLPDGSRRKRLFDGPYYTVPGSEQERWPSFPMRYATRRAALAGSGGVVPTGDGGVPPAPAGGTPVPGGGTPLPAPSGGPDF